MRVLNACPGADTGGVAVRLEAAFAKYGEDIEYRAIAANTNYIQYDTTVARARVRASEYRLAWRRADVVHINNNPQLPERFGMPFRPTILMFHGTEFRENTEENLQYIRKTKAPGIVSTLDLWLLAPEETVWVGCPYDADRLASLRVPNDTGVLRVAHAPTNRAIKSTDAFLAACARLGKELPLEVVLIEGRTWRDCLTAKASADIYFDQTLLGYGNNAIEAWGMGIPVIAGAQPDTLDEMEWRFGGLPFVVADEGNIYDALRHLADPDNRAHWAQRGNDHVRTFHSEEWAVKVLTPLYRQAA